MAISFFSSEDSISLPFANEFYASNKKLVGSIYEMESALLVKSGKGLMLNFSKFQVFLFKNQKLCKQLTAALENYCETGHGYKIIAQLTSNDPYYILGCDSEKPTNYVFFDGKYSCMVENSNFSHNTENPFLLKTPTNTKLSKGNPKDSLLDSKE